VSVRNLNCKFKSSLAVHFETLELETKEHENEDFVNGSSNIISIAIGDSGRLKLKCVLQELISKDTIN